jgi:uncharacterized membrane protein
VPGPDSLLFLALPVSIWLPPVVPAGVLAYGPAPGVEFIPYFLGLLAWAGLAVTAIVLAPISALFRRLRRARGAPPAGPKTEPTTASVPESPAGGSQDRA